MNSMIDFDTSLTRPSANSEMNSAAATLIGIDRRSAVRVTAIEPRMSGTKPNLGSAMVGYHSRPVSIVQKPTSSSARSAP
jgi:hypothetical protein